MSCNDQLIDAGLTSAQKFTADPRPIDDNIPTSLLEDIVFKKIMYTHQASYEEQLKKLGIKGEDDYTCTCYMDEVGNKPAKGEVLSWAESSAVVYANSVLGARCNRNSGIIELMGSIAGFVPEFGLLTDEGRKATWIVEVSAKKPEAQLLGSAIGMKVMEKVPYIKGLDKWLGTELERRRTAPISAIGAATASNGPLACTTSSTSRPRPCSRARHSSATVRRCTSSTTRSLSACGKLPRDMEKSSTPGRSCASSAART